MTRRKTALISKLQEVRERTLWLMGQVPDEMLRVRVHSFYSPIGWHFGHVGRTEEYWACIEALGRPPIDPALSFLLADTPENPKDNRINIPDRIGLEAYMAATRAHAIEALESADLDSESPLIRDGYAWEFAYQHECQHQETIAEMMMLIQQHRGDAALWEESIAPDWQPFRPPEFVPIAGGKFTMGSTDPHAYDNEHEPHEASVASFELQKWPTTCFEWSEFLKSGGYHRRELWSDDGWAWRCENDAERPFYWLKSKPWASFFPLGKRFLFPDEPVFGISWFEAEAFCQWNEARLPTEEEWEFAAKGSGHGIHAAPDSRTASYGLKRWRPSSVQELRDAMGQNGIGGMAGGVWEWCSSSFLPYPGFRAFPYDGYSKDHMKGKHKVCRGGSWASQAIILRSTFRNWYVPTYRQGFLGLRCAR